MGGNWVRLKGVVRPEDPPLRAFNLPGYVWYAAAAWRAFPRGHQYVQVPVVILLTVAVATTAAALGGPMLGLLSGVIAALDPFMVVHGPVWNDAVFGTALVWTIFAIAANRWRGAAYAWVSDIAISPLAALAALTRTEAQLLIVALAAVIWVLPSLRPLPRQSLFAVVGVFVAVTAWGARNQSALGVFHAGSTHDGITLWESNGPFARRALALGQVDHLSEDPRLMAPYWARTAAMTEAGADAYFRQEAVAYFESHPLDVAQTAVDKLVVSASGIRPEQSLLDRRNVVSIADTLLLIALSAVAVARLMARPVSSARVAALVMLAMIGAEVTGLLVIGPAGIRYWLTLRAALWIPTAAIMLRSTPVSFTGSENTR